MELTDFTEVTSESFHTLTDEKHPQKVLTHAVILTRLTGARVDNYQGI